MNVLKHPALFPIEFVPHEGGGDGVAAGDLRALGMAKTSVARLQFGQEILYLLLEFFIVGALEDLVSPGFRQLFPIRPVHTGIEVLPRHKLTDAGIDLLFRLRVETHRSPRGIAVSPSPTKTTAPQYYAATWPPSLASQSSSARRKALPFGWPSAIWM